MPTYRTTHTFMCAWEWCTYCTSHTTRKLVRNMDHHATMTTFVRLNAHIIMDMSGSEPDDTSSNTTESPSQTSDATAMLYMVCSRR